MGPANLLLSLLAVAPLSIPVSLGMDKDQLGLITQDTEAPGEPTVESPESLSLAVDRTQGRTEALRKQITLARPFVGILEISGPHNGSVMRQSGAFLLGPDLAACSALSLSGGHGLSMRLGDETRVAYVCGLDLMQDVALLSFDTPFSIEGGLPLLAGNLRGNEHGAMVGSTVLMEEISGQCALTGMVELNPLSPVGQVQNLAQLGLAGTPVLNQRGLVIGMLSSRVFQESGTRFVISGAALAQIPRMEPVSLSQNLVPPIPDNKDSDAYQAWESYQVGVNAMFAGHTERAIETLTGLQDARAQMWLAAALSKSDRDVEALEILTLALVQRPKSVTAHLLKGQAHTNLMQYQEAAQDFRLARTNDPSSLLANLSLAHSYLRLNRGQEALQVLSSALSAQPNHIPSLILRGRILTQRLRLTEARESFDAVLLLDPDSTAAWVGLGQLHLEQQQYKAAHTSFKSALAIDPRSLAANIGLCQVSVAQRRWADSLSLITPLLEQNKSNVPLITMAAKCQTRLRNFDEAKNLYEQATFLEPTNVDAFMGMGFTYQEMLNYDRAILSFDTVLRIDPKHSGAMFSAGFCHLQQGNRGEARARYKTLLPIDPGAADRLFKLIYNK